jgi:ClpA/ClpB-like protein
VRRSDCVPRPAVQRILQGRLRWARPRAERIAWTPFSRNAIAIASELAAQAGSPRIGCDHLLIGLARVGVAAAALHEVGLADISFAEAARSEARQRLRTRVSAIPPDDVGADNEVYNNM